MHSPSNQKLKPSVSVLARLGVIRRQACPLKASIDVAPPLNDYVFQISLSLGLVALTTASLLIFRHFYPLHYVSIVYLMPVLIAATRWGLVGGIVAAIAGAAITNFFFYPPIYTFWIDDPQHILELLIFTFVSFVACDLTERLRREAAIARRREREIRNLYEFSRELTTCSTAAEINRAIQKFIASQLRRHAVLLKSATRDSRDLEVIGGQPIPENIRRDAVAMMAAEKMMLSQTIVDKATKDVWFIKSVPAQVDDFGVIAVNLGRGSLASVEGVRRQVDAILDEAIAALVRLDIAMAISEARTRSQAELFREVLVGSVSHDLRSPLASILGLAGVLGQELARDARLLSLIQAIHDEAKRLDNDIEKVLDATRLSNEATQPRMDWHDPVDIINAAIARKKQPLARRHLKVDLPSDLPIIKVDSILLERALSELLENAVKYSPEGSTINLSAFTEHRRLVLRVRDAGIGLTHDEILRLGKRSFRGTGRNRLPGSGLGLWIANAFVTAIGGKISAESEGFTLGSAISISLPLHQESVSKFEDILDE